MLFIELLFSDEAMGDILKPWLNVGAKKDKGMHLTLEKKWKETMEEAREKWPL